MDPAAVAREQQENALSPGEVARLELDIGPLDRDQRLLACRAYGLYGHEQETAEEIARTDGLTVHTVHLRLRKLHADMARVQMERQRRAEQYRRDSAAQANFAARLIALADEMWAAGRQEQRERKALCRVVVASPARRRSGTAARASARGDPSPDSEPPLARASGGRL